jgi:hypothetical protein
VTDQRAVEARHLLMQVEGRVSREAIRLRQARERLLEAEEAVRRTLERLEEAAGSGAWLHCLLPVVAWLADFTLLSPGVEFLLAFLFAGGAPQWLVLVARAVIPLGLVVLELYLGVQAHRKRQLVLLPASPSKAAMPWLLAGFAVAVLPPLITVWAMFRAAAAIDPASADAVALQAGVFGFIGAAAHLATVLRAQQALEAWAWVGLRAGLAWGRWRSTSAAARQRTAVIRLEAAVRDYQHALEDFYQLTGRPWPMVLSEEVRQLIEEAIPGVMPRRAAAAGHEVIEAEEEVRG